MPSQSLSAKSKPVILLVDDHNLFRTGLAMILMQHPEWTPQILEAGSANEAVSRLREHPSVDIVLLDINMPGINGLDALRMLRPLCPLARIAILSATPEASAEKRSCDLGADGFISKAASATDIHRILSRLRIGYPYFPTLAPGDLAASNAPAASKGALTPRQLETLALMAEGSSNKVIARKLNLAENTVRVHVAAVIDHFDCTTRLEAVVAARKQGILA